MGMVSGGRYVQYVLMAFGRVLHCLDDWERDEMR